MPLTERRQIENEMIFRRANEKVGDNLDAIDAMHIEDDNPELIRNEDFKLQFKCECSDEKCDAQIPIKLSTYRKIHENRDAYIIKLKHQVTEIEQVTDSGIDYSVVEKNNSTAEPGNTLNTTAIDNTSFKKNKKSATVYSYQTYLLYSSMMKANAEVLLIQADGSVILQVRDDKPGIANPGLISSFGGHRELGEDLLDTAFREINEETNLKIKKEQLVFYRKCTKTKKLHGEDWDVYYYGVANVTTDGLQVYEGSGFTVIHDLKELRASKVTKLLHQVLTDYFQGFRRYVFYPDVDEQTRIKLREEYLHTILKGHTVSVFKSPVALACTGLVASGKSTITKPLAELIDAVSVSSDEIRELLYVNGFNFSGFRAIISDILIYLTDHHYNVFLDFNISTNVPKLDELSALGYKIYIVHANPPEAFIKQKILSGNMKHELTFFTKDEHVYESMLTWRDDHVQAFPELKQKYGIWYEIDTSRPDLQQEIQKMKDKFMHEIATVKR